ncbi:hypothetical protein ACFYSI_13525 [Staphylococcus xylosus]|uniref:hypothetical protein n=1 Tax=Staphylococcus TaxID=1279 RepID=UPI002709DCD3|nr:hypothetical protein [Staphylococcus xylosus]
MPFKTNMNKLEKIDRFKSMVADKLEILREYKTIDFKYECDNELMGVVVELNTMIFTTKELTEIKEIEIEKYINREIGMSIDELQTLENTFY